MTCGTWEDCAKVTGWRVVIVVTVWLRLYSKGGAVRQLEPRPMQEASESRDSASCAQKAELRSPVGGSGSPTLSLRWALIFEARAELIRNQQRRGCWAYPHKRKASSLNMTVPQSCTLPAYSRQGHARNKFHPPNDCFPAAANYTCCT